MAADILSRSRAYGFLEQSAWGTPGGLLSTYEALRIDANSGQLDMDLDTSQNDTTTTTGVIIERARSITDSVTGLPKFSYTMPVDRQNLAIHLAAALHNVKEVNATGYQKTFTPLMETEVIDFSTITNKEPHVYTLAGYFGAGQDTKAFLLECAIINSLGLTIDFNARGVSRFMQLSAQWVGNELNLEQDISQNAFSNSYTSVWMNQSSGFSFDIAGLANLTDVCIKRYSLNINNNVFSDCKTTGGKANNYKVNTEITCEVVIPLSGTVIPIFPTVQNGTEATFTLDSAITTGNAGHFNVITKGRIINSVIHGDANGYQEMTLTMRCEKPDSGSSCTIVLADGIDRNWLAT